MVVEITNCIRIPDDGQSCYIPVVAVVYTARLKKDSGD
jgi:hypothetical protein